MEITQVSWCNVSKNARAQPQISYPLPYYYPADTLYLIPPANAWQGVQPVNRFYDLPEPSGNELQVTITYTTNSKVRPSSGSEAIRDDKGLYFINSQHQIPGKPVQIWTQGETESNSNWLPTIDKPNERFTITTRLTVPDSFTTLANGELTRSQKLPGALREDVWEMSKPIQPYVAMFAIGKYEITKDQNALETIPVAYYTEPAYAPYATKMFSNTPEMIKLFSSYTGVPYPWNKYSQVVARDYVSGAMENTTASLFGEFVNKNFRELADDDNEEVVSPRTVPPMVWRLCHGRKLEQPDGKRELCKLWRTAVAKP